MRRRCQWGACLNEAVYLTTCERPCGHDSGGVGGGRQRVGGLPAVRCLAAQKSGGFTLDRVFAMRHGQRGRGGPDEESYVKVTAIRVDGTATILGDRIEIYPDPRRWRRAKAWLRRRVLRRCYAFVTDNPEPSYNGVYVVTQGTWARISAAWEMEDE